jgi:hypothetical protein
MCSKASIFPSLHLIRCRHQKRHGTSECGRATSAEPARAKGLDARPACGEVATLRLGHEPGICNPVGNSRPSRPRFRALRSGKGFRCQLRRFVSAKSARQNQGTLGAIPGETFTRAGSAGTITPGMAGVIHDGRIPTVKARLTAGERRDRNERGSSLRYCQETGLGWLRVGWCKWASRMTNLSRHR